MTYFSMRLNVGDILHCDECGQLVIGKKEAEENLWYGIHVYLEEAVRQDNCIGRVRCDKCFALYLFKVECFIDEETKIVLWDKAVKASEWYDLLTIVKLYGSYVSKAIKSELEKMETVMSKPYPLSKDLKKNLEKQVALMLGVKEIIFNEELK